MRLTCFCIVESTMSFLRRRRRRLRDFSCIPWLPPPFGRRTRPLPVTRKRLAAAFLVFIFGMTPPWCRSGRADALGKERDGSEKPAGSGARKMMGKSPLVKRGARPLRSARDRDDSGVCNGHEGIGEPSHRGRRPLGRHRHALAFTHVLADVEVEL